jgi:TonB family protein
VQPSAVKEVASRISNTASRLSRELTPKTTIGVPGPGGEAFANYSQVVISIYERAWIKPVGIEQTAVVKATVTIRRDGRVVSTRITKLSGNRTVDDSVEQVLERVKEVRPFPEGAKDDTRTFDLSFELTPADLTG